MVSKRKNSTNITRGVAAEKTEKWEKQKKKGLKQQKAEIVTTIFSIMGTVNNPPALEAIGLQPYKNEYDLLFEKLGGYFKEWREDKQAKEFINGWCLTKEEKEKRKQKEVAKTKEEKKKDEEEKLQFIAKTAAELSDILLQYGSALFEAAWKVKQSTDQNTGAEKEICMKDFYPELMTFKTFLENERLSREFLALDLLVQWIQKLNSYLVLAWQIDYGKQRDMTKEEAEDDNLCSPTFYGKKEEDINRVSSRNEKKEKKKADLALALTNTLYYCIVHYHPEEENADFGRYYHKCAGMVSSWMRYDFPDELKQLSEREQKIASDIFKAQEEFEKIKNAIRHSKSEKDIDYYRNYPKVYKFLEKHQAELPTLEQIQYLIRQNNKDAYSLEAIQNVLEKLERINNGPSSLEAMNEKGEKNRTNSKTNEMFNNITWNRGFDELKKDSNDLKGSFILNSQKEEDILSVVVTTLKYEHSFETEEIAKKLGMTKENIEIVLGDIRSRA